MRTTLILLLFLFHLVCIAQVHVRAYYRKDGTYVQSHYRSNPDGNPYNNWSFPGNVNPYTGKIAPGNPDTYLYNYYNRNSYPRVTTNYPSVYYYPSTNTYTPEKKREESNYQYQQNYDIYYVNTEQLNVRLGPSLEYQIVGTLNYRDKIKIISYTDEPWYMIRVEAYDSVSKNFEPTYGYILNNYITHSKPYETAVQFNSDGTQSYPNNNFDYKSETYRSNSDYDNDVIYYVTASKLNFRTGPSQDYPVLNELRFKDPVKIISLENYPWYEVGAIIYDSLSGNYRKTVGYVHADYISSTFPSDESQYSFKDSFSQPTPHPIIDHPYGENNGKLTFWTDCSYDGYISIYVDDVYVGELKVYFENVPGCDAPGTLPTVVPAGAHSIKAKGKTKTWSGVVTVTEDNCLVERLKR